MKEVVCITNNPRVRERFPSSRLIDGTAREVFTEARDLIHKGWCFLGHPQYGNFQPSRQPYRTLVLEKDGEANPVDLESFGMIEDAMSKMNKTISPNELPEEMRHDFAFIDLELMKDTLERFLGK